MNSYSSSVKGCQEKTHRAGLLRVLLPGLWYEAESGSNGQKAAPKRGSDMNLGHGFGTLGVSDGIN